MERKHYFHSICRTCLGSRNLNPIFNNKKLNYKYSTFIFLATGIKVDSNDGLPQNICRACISLINKSMKFRHLCKENAKKLLNIMTRKTIEEKDSIQIGQVHDSFEEDSEHLDSTFSEDTDISEGNVKIESKNIDNQILYNEENKSKIENSVHLLTKNNYDDLYNDNETEYKHNNNLENSNNIITDDVNSYNIIDSNNEKEYHNNGELYNHNEAFDEKSHNHNKVSFKTDSKTINTKEYNHNKSHNDKLHNHNKLSYETDSKPSNNNKECYYNELDKSYNHNELSYNNDPKSKYMISTKNNRVICKICSKNLAVRSFDMHIWKCHPGVDERKVLCHLCNEYTAKVRMKTHIEKHGDNFTCVYCNNVHESKELLAEHTVSCSQKIKKRTPCKTSKELKECDICHKMMQKGSLRLHKEVKHAGLGPICEHCNKKFSNKFRLMEHLRAKHGYDKFKCKLCHFETASEVSLKNHERRHSGVKPYLCEKCGAKFHAAYLLAQHRNSHTTDKMYKCDQCPASFKTNNSLHMHKMTCHSSKSLNCSICARAYNCRHYLVKHMRGVHRYSGPIIT